jgi:hypothetical protein
MGRQSILDETVMEITNTTEPNKQKIYKDYETFVWSNP